jgi:hypothetical protein
MDEPHKHVIFQTWQVQEGHVTGGGSQEEGGSLVGEAVGEEKELLEGGKKKIY